MKITITHQFQDFLSSIGLDLRALLQEAGVADLTWQEEISLSVLDYHSLLLALDHHLTDEQVLVLSDIRAIQMFMPPFFAALSAKNGLAAIQHFAKYKKISGPVVVSIDEFEDLVRVQFRFDYPEHDLPRIALLNEQLLLLSMVRTGLGQDIVPVQVTSSFVYGSDISEVFGVEAVQAEGNELIFKRSDLEQPFLTANNLMLEYLEPQLKQRLADLEQEKNLTSKVEEKLFKLIPSGAFSVDEIAAELDLSGRSLQRHLSLEGKSFKEVLQGVQKLMAINYMTDKKLSVDEIAYLVGYTEVSSFSRAFKKWTGKTVGQYRRDMDERKSVKSMIVMD